MSELTREQLAYFSMKATNPESLRSVLDFEFPDCDVTLVFIVRQDGRRFLVNAFFTEPPANELMPIYSQYKREKIKAHLLAVGAPGYSEHAKMAYIFLWKKL